MLKKSLQRGFDDTCQLFGGWSAAIPIVFVFPVGLVLHWFFGDRTELLDVVWVWLLYGLASTLLVFLGLLIWNFAWAPYRIERDLRKSLESKFGLPEDTPGIEGESVSALDAAWEMLIHAVPLKEAFERACESDRARIWHCLVWLRKLAAIGEIRLYGRELGSRLYRVIEFDRIGYSLSVSDETNQFYRVNEHLKIGDLLEGRKIERFVWGDDVRVLTAELNTIIAGFNSGKVDDWSDLPELSERSQQKKEAE